MQKSTSTPLLLLAALVAVLGTIAAQAAELRQIRFPGVWEGAAYSDDKTGEFSTCIASAEYSNNTFVYVMVERDYSWSLGFANNEWRIPLEGTMQVSYRFDGGLWYEATAGAIDESFFHIPMPADATLIDLFRRGNKMEVSFHEGRYTFNLTSTFKLVAALAECVASYVGVPEDRTTVAEAPQPESPPSGPLPSSGTGIVVGSEGLVLTNFHVVEHCQAIKVTQSGDLARPAQLLRSDKLNDLALLKVETSYAPDDVATFRQGASGKAGETIAVYGYPLSGMLSVSGNIVSGNITALSGLQDDVRFFQISAPVQPGNSGGPLMDAGGLVLGVVNARISDVAVLGATGAVPQNINFAIKGSVATSFLDAHSVPYSSAATAPELTLVAIAERAKRFGVFIQCP
ncbi:MAG: trypsin-like peptidase domain-containing protein [Devosia sp.]|nr:trypsin-like peptidase domain-containing protein [Devosia sp.]